MAQVKCGIWNATLGTLEGGVEGDKVFCYTLACLSVTRHTVYLFLRVPSPPSASSFRALALASKLDRVPAHGFAPLPPLWCGISLVCFTSCQWSLPGPPLSLASQTSPASLQGPSSSLCFFPHWPSSSSLVLRFDFSSGLSQEYARGGLFGSSGNLILLTLYEKIGAERARSLNCPFLFSPFAFLVTSEGSLISVPLVHPFSASANYIASSILPGPMYTSSSWAHLKPPHPHFLPGVQRPCHS